MSIFDDPDKALALLKSKEPKDGMYAQESTITTKTKKFLDSLPYVAYYKASDRYTEGVSDFIVNVAGVFVFLELKARNGKPSAAQILFVEEHLKVGGVGGVCYTMKEVINYVNQGKRISDSRNI